MIKNWNELSNKVEEAYMNTKRRIGIKGYDDRKKCF